MYNKLKSLHNEYLNVFRGRLKEKDYIYTLKGNFDVYLNNKLIIKNKKSMQFKIGHSESEDLIKNKTTKWKTTIKQP